MQKVLVAIVNYNQNKQALYLKAALSKQFDTVIIDSGSDIQLPEFDIQLDNVGYSGLFNRAVQEAIEKGYESLFLVCSDVDIAEVDIPLLKKHIAELPEDVGVYSPSTMGRCHGQCYNHQTNNLRDVLFVEGFLFVAKVELLKQMYPIDLTINKLGWGLDACKGFLCKKNNLRCVIDDRITIYHPPGTGYSQGIANDQMLAFMRLPENLGLEQFWNDFMNPK